MMTLDTYFSSALNTPRESRAIPNFNGITTHFALYCLEPVGFYWWTSYTIFSIYTATLPFMFMNDPSANSTRNERNGIKGLNKTQSLRITSLPNHFFVTAWNGKCPAAPCPSARATDRAIIKVKLPPHAPQMLINIFRRGVAEVF